MASPSHDEKRLNLALVLYYAQKPEKNLKSFVKEYVEFSGGGDAAEGEAMFELCKKMIHDAIAADLRGRPDKGTNQILSFSDQMLQKYPFLTSKILDSLYATACADNWREG